MQRGGNWYRFHVLVHNSLQKMGIIWYKFTRNLCKKWYVFYTKFTEYILIQNFTYSFICKKTGIHAKLYEQSVGKNGEHFKQKSPVIHGKIMLWRIKLCSEVHNYAVLRDTSWRGRLEPQSWSTEFCVREKETGKLYTLAFTPAFGIQGVTASLYFNIFMSTIFPLV